MVIAFTKLHPVSPALPNKHNKKNLKCCLARRQSSSSDFYKPAWSKTKVLCMVTVALKLAAVPPTGKEEVKTRETDRQIGKADRQTDYSLCANCQHWAQQPGHGSPASGAPASDPGDEWTTVLRRLCPRSVTAHPALLGCVHHCRL